MKLTKKYLRQLIRESVSELHNKLTEAKTFQVSYKDKKGKDRAIKVKASDEKEAMATARQRLRGKFYDLYYAKELDEMTTTADVAGYDAPMNMKLKDIVDDEDDV
jgi:hypothetical protein